MIPNELLGLSNADVNKIEKKIIIIFFPQRMRESESSLQQLTTEREERERERWSLLRHARDEAERSLSLAAQLAAKDAHIQQLQENLDEVRHPLFKPSLIVLCLSFLR